MRIIMTYFIDIMITDLNEVSTIMIGQLLGLSHYQTSSHSNWTWGGQ